MEITVLGGGRSIGANCLLVSSRGASLLIDAGLHPQRTGFSALPLLEHILTPPDAIVITHAHLDHIGGLPVVCRMFPKTPVYMTRATALLGRHILEDAGRLMTIRGEPDRSLYYETYYRPEHLDHILPHFLGDPPFDLLDRDPWEDLLDDDDLFDGLPGPVRVIPYDRPVRVRPGFSFTLLDAGHLLGAAGVLLRSREATVLLTGDFKLQAQKIRGGARFPSRPGQVDILVTESSYAGRKAPAFDEEVRRLGDFVLETVSQGGSVLFPAFALGRTQELLAVIDSLRERSPILRDIPVHISSGLARKTTGVYSRLTGRHFSVRPIPKPKHHAEFFADPANHPAILIATSASLQKGTAAHSLAPYILSDPRHAIVFTGHIFKGSLAETVAKAAAERAAEVAWEGRRIPLRCRVGVFSLSSHADDSDLRRLIRSLKPANIVLVHGEAEAMDAMAKSLGSAATTVACPANAEHLTLRNDTRRIVSAMSLKALITTVGTSLHDRHSRTPSAAGTPSPKDLLDLLRNEGPSVCAEAYSLHHLRGRLDFGSCRLYLVASATDAGRTAAEALRLRYAHDFPAVDLLTVDGLVPDEERFAREGLPRLLDLLAHVIETHGRNAALNVTGGFKAATACATALGLLYNVPVYYAFQDFADIIEIPPLPLGFDRASVDPHWERLNAVLDARTPAEAHRLHDGLPAGLRNLLRFNPALGRYEPTPLGRLLLRAYRYSDQTRR